MATVIIFSSCSQKDVVDSGKNYKIYKTNLTEVNYQIFNNKNEVVLHEQTDRPLKINIIDDGILDIAKGMGTGITVHKYYDTEKDVFSNEFMYVLGAYKNIISYIEISDKMPRENRKIVFRNIFEPEFYREEFVLNFANVDTPVIVANFSEDGKSFTVKYLSGNEQKEVTEVLELNR